MRTGSINVRRYLRSVSVTWSSAWDSNPESPDQADLLGIFLRYVVTNRFILSYSLLSYLDAPIIVMGVQQVPGLHKQRPKNYSYEKSHSSGLPIHPQGP